MITEEFNTAQRRTYIQSTHKQQDSDSPWPSAQISFSSKHTKICSPRCRALMLSNTSSHQHKNILNMFFNETCNYSRQVPTNNTSHEQEINTTGDKSKITSICIQKEDSCTKETRQDR